MEPDILRVGIVGVGPRGLSVLERICAGERENRAHAAVIVHIVDPAPPGAGQVWRVAQSPQLLMNTVASQVTVYTDESIEMGGPVEPGPSLYEWARSFAAVPGQRGRDARLRAQAADLGPDAYPTRSLYGRYLEDAFRSIIDRAPRHVSVRIHRATALRLDTVDGAQNLKLGDGTSLIGLDAVVLALGHVPAVPKPAERELLRAAEQLGLLYIPPCNPADVDLSVIAPGQSVLLRGLGLNFFDHLALLTAGRGGRFERTGDGLVYHPSGREPQLYAGSRRGIPYHARGENQKGALGRHHPAVLTPEVISKLRERAEQGDPVRFGEDVWPLIAREAEGVYYRTLLASRGREAEARSLAAAFANSGPQGDGELLARYGIDEADRWDWEAIAHPCGDTVFASRAQFHGWLLDYLARDLRESRAGNVDGPLKAALDTLRDLRNEVRLVVDHRGLDGESYRDELDGWYTPLNAFVSIGPPASRIEEMIALIRCGVLTVLGPGMRVRVRDGRFRASAERVREPEVVASALIEARLPQPDLRRTADPLLGYLLATGQCAAYRIPGSRGTSYETGGLAVTERPYRVLDAQGMAHPRRFAFGVPTESVHWATAAGIRPGVNSVTLGDSDAIARAVLALTAVPAPRRVPRTRELTEVVV